MTPSDKGKKYERELPLVQIIALMGRKPSLAVTFFNEPIHGISMHLDSQPHFIGASFALMRKL
ncbi:hypothetical protein CMK12_15440 [Candidatus Poribacteria bacterium]|nr:hypothetical protein [Candidatus Poribacteria bacterium]